MKTENLYCKECGSEVKASQSYTQLRVDFSCKNRFCKNSKEKKLWGRNLIDDDLPKFVERGNEEMRERRDKKEMSHVSDANRYIMKAIGGKRRRIMKEIEGAWKGRQWKEKDVRVLEKYGMIKREGKLDDVIMNLQEGRRAKLRRLCKRCSRMGCDIWRANYLGTNRSDCGGFMTGKIKLKKGKRGKT